MPKFEPKTRETDAGVDEFLNSVGNGTRREDAFRVLAMFKRATGDDAKMWGNAIVGFGRSPVKYADGSELDWPAVGFSPRKQNMTLYVMSGSPKLDGFLEKLGAHTTSKSCLYIKRLSDIDEKVLEKLIKDCVAYGKGKKKTPL